MDRREFLSWTGAGWIAASLPVAIAACTSETTTTTPPTPDDSAATTDAPAPTDSTEVASADGFVNIERTVDTLDSDGSVGNDDLDVVPEKVIVIRDPDNSANLLALTSNCNHRNCTVDWSASDSRFVCPCHQTAFLTDGSIVPNSGPATAPLRVLQARVNSADEIEVRF